MSTSFVRDQFRLAFDMPDIDAGREYLDVVVSHFPALERVAVTPVHSPVSGTWFAPPNLEHERVILYLHGGGYCFAPISHMNTAAMLALASNAKTFAARYRLAPENPFPAQLEDVHRAYDWLLASGLGASDIIVAGDSAGGNLCLSLLLDLRDRRRSLPALAICISPWTDIGNSGDSMLHNEPYDIIGRRMCDIGARRYVGEGQVAHPLISPLHADLSGLPPIYIQAGGAEIFIDMIKSFAQRGKDQGAEINLEVWENMNHDFQVYGEQMAESREAWRRVGKVVSEYLG
jgi:acetyl esterase/lipase